MQNLFKTCLLTSPLGNTLQCTVTSENSKIVSKDEILVISMVPVNDDSNL